MPRLSVDTKKCLKSGQCTYLHPDLLQEGPDGRPVVLVAEPSGAQIQEAEDAAEICPAMAIILEA
ncbi:MAG: ferredoxin [Chloroflexi bacterium]|nr:ferredoxin [Chloroflexota bacterium]